jgi:hypothetical protein
MRRTSLLLATAVSSLALAACGGGGKSDEDQIKSAIQEVGKDPASLCTKNGSAALVKAAGGKDACLQLAKKSGQGDAQLDVSGIKVNGDSATATVTNGSGAGKGQKSAVRMIKENGDWKIAG